MAFVNGDGGGLEGQTAAFTPLGGEPTLYQFSPEHVDNAQRFVYRADESGAVYALEFLITPLNTPEQINHTAGIYANIWNQNAALPGVEEISETQVVRPLGGLDDVAQVAITSDRGTMTAIINVAPENYRPDLFAPIVAEAVAALNTLEAGG